MLGEISEGSLIPSVAPEVSIVIRSIIERPDTFGASDCVDISYCDQKFVQDHITCCN